MAFQQAVVNDTMTHWSVFFFRLPSLEKLDSWDARPALISSQHAGLASHDFFAYDASDGGLLS